MDTCAQPVKRTFLPVTRLPRLLHGWLGVAAAAFLVLFFVTGILLNHSSTLGLDSRFIEQRWLLDYYGIRSPDPGPSFAVEGQRVTFADGWLYLDAEPVTAGIAALTGAVGLGGQIAAVTSTELLILSPDGEVSERWPVDLSIDGPINAVAAAESGVAMRSAGVIYVFDWDTAEIDVVNLPSEALDWARASAVGPDLASAIQQSYRGRGMSWERLLADVHSGRIAGLPGVIVIDVAAVALLILALSGFVIWLRR